MPKVRASREVSLYVRQNVSVARPPDGTRAAARSRTALLAHVAARHAGLTNRGRAAFLRGLGIKVDEGGITRALREHRRPPGNDARAAKRPAGDTRAYLWDSVEVDSFGLGLDLTLAWLPPPAESRTVQEQDQLLGQLRALSGVARLYDCYGDTIVVVCLTLDPKSKTALERALRELCPSLLWAEARSADHELLARAYRDLLVQVAREEDRLS